MIASVKENGGGRFAVTMTAKVKERFMSGILECCKYYDMLGRVNAETSDCSRASDRESIHEGIRPSVGFAQLNRMVFGIMEGWIKDQLRGQAAASANAGDDNRAMKWNSTLATILEKQGQYDEAVVLLEAVLEFRLRVLPENDPEIGALFIVALFAWRDN